MKTNKDWLKYFGVVALLILIFWLMPELLRIRIATDQWILSLF